jgi:hypothetical protein
MWVNEMVRDVICFKMNTTNDQFRQDGEIEFDLPPTVQDTSFKK